MPDAESPAPIMESMTEDDVTEIVDLISVAYADKRPVLMEDANTKKAWELLRKVEKDPNILQAQHLLKLDKVEWFSDFFTPIMMNTLYPSNGPHMTYSEMIQLLKKACPDVPPGEGQSMLTTTNNGHPIMFVPEKALAAITQSWFKDNGPSVHDKIMFETLLPWGRAWIAKSSCFGTSKKRTVALKVSVANKIALLKIFHLHSAPTYKDYYPVTVGSDDVYIFRPSEWLGDIANNWFEGNRHSVKLSEAETKELEDIPWFKTWLSKIEKLRHNKRCRSDSMLKPYTAQTKKFKSS